MGTLLWIDAPGYQEGRDRARPIEGRPPWSLRSATDRRIVPSSRSPNLERRRLRVSGARSWDNNLIGTSDPSHGAGGHSGHKVNRSSLSSHGLDPSHHGHR